MPTGVYYREKIGRTPNVECFFCKKPIYRQPNVIKKSVTGRFACGDCNSKSVKLRQIENPHYYQAMIEAAKKIKGTHLKPEKYICIDCGGAKSYSATRCKKCFINFNKGENNPNWGGKISVRGENHWNWKGGISPNDRLERQKFRQTIQKKVLKRDNYTCQMCGDRGCALQVDHIQPWSEYVELRFSMDNCRTLCMSCHYKITFGREMPQEIKSWGHNFLRLEDN